jgi:alpha-methylacyl-CoA racemase
MAGPLHGLKIIEMAGLGPCPLAGQLMADLGAEVIVIERAAGGPRPADINNRNKQSLALNLKTPDGVALVLDLIEHADVLIEGYRPGVMEKLGLGPEAAMARNPRLVFGRITGWGQQGPLSRQAGHDLNYLALTGLLHMMGGADRPPMPPLNLVADYGGGAMFLIFGVLSALFERSISGAGQVVDAAMVEGVTAFSGVFRTLAANDRWTQTREANLLDGGAPYYRVYETKDGKFISVAAIEPPFFAELVAKAQIPAELAANREDRLSWPQQRAEYAAIFASKTRAQWEEIFAQSDACVVPVLTPQEAETHAHTQARATYTEVDGGLQPSPSPRFSRSQVADPRPAMPAGAGTVDILRQLERDEQTIQTLQKTGVVFAPSS